MKKILIFGNSGAGKTTLARHLVDRHGLAHLDLDTVTWDSSGVRKSYADSVQQVHLFIQQNTGWVIEGCYGSLIQEVAQFCNEMHFLNPGVEQCLRNNRQRPWESHKYPSQQAQDENLAMLQAWVKEYTTRQDEYSLNFHRMIYNNFTGRKQEHTRLILADDKGRPAV